MRTLKQIAISIRESDERAVFAPLSARAVLYCAAAIIHAVELVESRLATIEALLGRRP